MLLTESRAWKSLGNYFEYSASRKMYGHLPGICAGIITLYVENRISLNVQDSMYVNLELFRPLAWPFDNYSYYFPSHTNYENRAFICYFLSAMTAP